MTAALSAGGPDWRALYGEPTLALVVGDFGRAATVRFCAALCEAERRAIAARLPAGAPFFDEYRRLTLALSADLRYLKAERLADFAAAGRPLDDTVLVGFDGGPKMAQVAARIGVLVLEAIAGPLHRGCGRARVLLPCNTLAPAIRYVAERLASAAGLAELLEFAGVSPGRRGELEQLGARLREQVDLGFPTVPEGVLRVVAAGVPGQRGGDAALVLGTAGTPALYAEAAAGLDSPVTLLDVRPAWQAASLDAIRAAIADDPEGRRVAREALARVAAEAAAAHGGAVTLIEACTDLDYGVGLDSARAYAQAVVDEVYRVDEGHA